MEMVQSYIDKIGYSKTPLEYLKENKGFVKIKNGKEMISGAALLLFGKNPQLYFPRARIRFIRFEGTEEKVGAEMNVIKDVIIVVESPGKLPGLVKANNIRHTHFSRNPRIAEYLKAYEYVKEYGEGVDRMCTELENAGLRHPVYYIDAFILKTIVYNASAEKSVLTSKNPIIQTENPIIEENNPIIQNDKLTIEEMRCAIAKKFYNLPTQKNLLKVYDEIDAKQVFGAPEIQRILDCSPTTSRAIMSKLREIEVVEAVRGNGKGRYVFKTKGVAGCIPAADWAGASHI